MSRELIYKVLRNIAKAAFCLPLLTACSAVTDGEYADKQGGAETHDGKTFINLTVTVSGGSEAEGMTRAGEKPTEGENGDGREQGFPHEYSVTGITLMLYQDAVGINSASPSSVLLDYVKYYPVSLVSAGSPTPGAGADYGNTKTADAAYTTGNQLVQQGTLDMTKKYHAIVVANADLTTVFSTSSKLSDVLNYKLTTLYSGSETTTPATDCVHFVMSSESDDVIDFTTTAPTVITGGSLYSFTGLRIERMAARIDFWAANSLGYKDKDAVGVNYAKPGYAYQVGSSADVFVVTGFMPFNMNGGNSTNGGEFLIKRVADAVTATPNITFLADESGSNYVLDPATTTKTDGTLTYYKNLLENMAPLASVTDLSTNAYYKSVKDNRTTLLSLTEGLLTGEDIVLAYPMENTLWEASRLFKNATGLAIEGDYYHDNKGTPTHRIYYGYLRHEGTSSSAYPAMLASALSATATTTAANCMEYGIVRNNIYRVYVSSISPDGSMKLMIKVKKWDKFLHDKIIM